MSALTNNKGVEYKEESFIEENSEETQQTKTTCDDKGCTTKKRVSFKMDTVDNESDSESEAGDAVPFWSENPNVILQSSYVLELFPTENMSMNQKLNAITRLIILFTLVGFVYTKNVRILIISVIILFCIYLLYLYKVRNTASSKEGYENPAEKFYNSDALGKTRFTTPTLTNPFSNVLITDYEDNPQKLPAPPTDDTDINTQIMNSAKEMVTKLNPGQPDIADKLFSDLGDNFNFEHFMRPFFSTASTEIPNDQQAFAEFCYGSMISCKEGNKFACARNLPRYANY